MVIVCTLMLHTHLTPCPSHVFRYSLSVSDHHQLRGLCALRNTVQSLLSKQETSPRPWPSKGPTHDAHNSDSLRALLKTSREQVKFEANCRMLCRTCPSDTVHQKPTFNDTGTRPTSINSIQIHCDHLGYYRVTGTSHSIRTHCNELSYGFTLIGFTILTEPALHVGSATNSMPVVDSSARGTSTPTVSGGGLKHIARHVQCAQPHEIRTPTGQEHAQRAFPLVSAQHRRRCASATCVLVAGQRLLRAAAARHG